MKESKLIQMQNKIEVLGSALKNALLRINALHQLTEGLMASFQIHVGKDEWENIMQQLKDINEKAEEKPSEDSSETKVFESVGKDG
tara:strand:+ start:10885 stop:11142 length:258 start_codon:yes stop_codon:yes gene_type:complete